MSEPFVYGIHAVSALLNNPRRDIRMVMVSQDSPNVKLKDIARMAQAQSIPVEYWNTKTLDKKFPNTTHQGVAAHVSPLPDYNEADLSALLHASKKPALILMLDGVTDPHNLGACLRSADAAGVDFVVIPKDKSASITPTVSKVACGAAESVPVVYVTNLARAMEKLKQEGVWIYGADGNTTQSIYEFDFKGNVALVMGAEGEGMRRLTRELCDGVFALPMQGFVASLNVSVATGVSLYEVVRQRL